MGLPVYNLNRSEWRTPLQPIVGVLEVEDAVETVDVVAAVVVDADVVDVVERRTRNGSPLPSLDVWSRMERSSRWRRSTSSPCPLKSSRSSTTSLAPLLRMKF